MDEIGSKIYGKWRKLGMSLGLQRPTLDKIWEKHWNKKDTSHTDAAEEMFTIWCTEGPRPCTWMRIVDSLSSIHEKSLSKTLQMKYCC